MKEYTKRQGNLSYSKFTYGVYSKMLLSPAGTFTLHEQWTRPDSKLIIYSMYMIYYLLQNFTVFLFSISYNFAKNENYSKN